MTRIRVVAFASAGDIIGAEGTEVTIPAEGRLHHVARALQARFPALEAQWDRWAIAVDGRLVATGDDPTLADGAEVALLPPVSGGSPKPARTRLTDERIDTDAVCRAVSGDGRGAAVLFLGTVRDHNQGRTVTRLVYHGYRAMAETTLETIAAELEDAAPGLAVAIVHRLGDVPIGEPSVAIAVASPHRDAAYAASREALERLKREVPIWKREHYADGEVAWREEEALGARGHASSAPSGSAPATTATPS